MGRGSIYKPVAKPVAAFPSLRHSGQPSLRRAAEREGETELFEIVFYAGRATGRQMPAPPVASGLLPETSTCNSWA